MNYLFFINPMGGVKKTSFLKEKIDEVGAKLNVKMEVYYTFIENNISRCREIIEKAPRPLRVYACGGDGSLNEIVSASYGCEGVEIGCIPLGTGNDFVRNFTGDFLNVEHQIKGKSLSCDLISYNSSSEKGICVNMINIGFDANVVHKADEIKRKTPIKGSLAYLCSVFVTLLKKSGAEVIVTLEDGSEIKNQLLLVSIANGCFCGGGIKGLPEAKVADNLIDLSIIKDVSRIRFLNLFPKYAKGIHLGAKKIEEILVYKKCKSLRVAPTGETMRLAVDGEIKNLGVVDFKVISKGFKFIVPLNE